MSNKTLQEKWIQLQLEKRAVLQQIKDIRDERKNKRGGKTAHLYEVVPNSVDPVMRDLELKFFDLKSQLEKISYQLLIKGKLTEAVKVLEDQDKEIAAKEAANKKAARKAQRRTS